MEPTPSNTTSFPRVNIAELAAQIHVLAQQRDNESKFPCNDLPKANPVIVSELNELIAS